MSKCAKKHSINCTLLRGPFISIILYIILYCIICMYSFFSHSVLKMKHTFFLKGYELLSGLIKRILETVTV